MPKSTRTILRAITLAMERAGLFPISRPAPFRATRWGHAVNDRRFWRMITAAEQAAEERSRQRIFFETRGVAAKLGVKLATVRRYTTTGRLKAATRIAAPPARWCRELRTPNPAPEIVLDIA